LSLGAPPSDLSAVLAVMPVAGPGVVTLHSLVCPIGQAAEAVDPTVQVDSGF